MAQGHQKQNGTPEDETRVVALANRSFCWSFLARAYACEPDEDFIALIKSTQTREEFALIEDEHTESLCAAYDRVAEAAQGPNATERLSQEYVKVFVGPDILKAQPWENVQLTGKKVLFQSGVLSVRDSYRAAGFLPVRYPHVADDFIGIECDFMGKLATSAWQLESEGDAAGSQEALVHSRRFLDEHLGLWAGMYADQVARGYGDCFYARIADLLVCQIERDRDLLEFLSQ